MPAHVFVDAAFIRYSWPLHFAVSWALLTFFILISDIGDKVILNMINSKPYMPKYCKFRRIPLGCISPSLRQLNLCTSKLYIWLHRHTRHTALYHFVCERILCEKDVTVEILCFHMASDCGLRYAFLSTNGNMKGHDATHSITQIMGM